MAFFGKLRDRLFKSSSRLEEGLDAIVEEGGEDQAAPEVEAEVVPEPAPAPAPEPTPEPEPVSGAERAFAEQTATHLFFESLVQNIREVPEAADLGLRDPAANEGEDTGFTARSEGDIAADRFREGLKLVSA